jgi:hypothetical protein
MDKLTGSFKVIPLANNGSDSVSNSNSCYVYVLSDDEAIDLLAASKRAYKAYKRLADWMGDYKEYATETNVCDRYFYEEIEPRINRLGARILDMLIAIDNDDVIWIDTKHRREGVAGELLNAFYNCICSRVVNVYSGEIPELKHLKTVFSEIEQDYIEQYNIYKLLDDENKKRLVENLKKERNRNARILR